jgi:hypothetical protein
VSHWWFPAGIAGVAVAAIVVLLPGNEQVLGWSQTRGPWTAERPDEARRTAGFAAPKLTESSGVTVSRRLPGVLWTHNDGGNEPVLFATDTAGRALGSAALAGVRKNVDWEAIGLGPCGEAEDCIYLADTGDNQSERPSVTLYRVREPAAARGSRTLAPVDSLRLRYADGARDVEAMLVAPGGDVLLVAKTFRGDVPWYRVPSAEWSGGRAAAGRPVTLPRAGTVPIDPTSAFGRWVTDAAMAPDGVHAALRTYRDLYLFRLERGALVPATRPARCDIGGLESQGEGVAWLDRRTLVLTSERAFGSPGAIHVVRCPSFRVDDPRPRPPPPSIPPNPTNAFDDADSARSATRRAGRRDRRGADGGPAGRPRRTPGRGRRERRERRDARGAGRRHGRHARAPRVPRGRRARGAGAGHARRRAGREVHRRAVPPARAGAAAARALMRSPLPAVARLDIFSRSSAKRTAMHSPGKCSRKPR